MAPFCKLIYGTILVHLKCCNIAKPHTARKIGVCRFEIGIKAPIGLRLAAVGVGKFCVGALLATFAVTFWITSDHRNTYKCL